MVDLTYPLDHDVSLKIVTPDGPKALAALPALDGASAGGGGDESVSRRAVRHRSGDRRGLLLRLRRAASVRARGPREDRSEDEGAGVAGSALRAADVAEERGDRVLHQARRAAQGPAHPGEDRRSVRGLLLHDQGPRHVRRFLRRAARAVDQESARVQAALRVERVLEGRRAQPADAADLRDRLLQGRRSQAAPASARGSEEARSPQARQGARAVHVASVGARRGVLARERHDALQPARELHARGALPRRATSRSRRR